jgi:arylformamidase
MAKNMLAHSRVPASEWIDISLPMGENMPILPSAAAAGPMPNANIRRFWDTARGDKVTMTRIEIMTHDSTHIDAPLHFSPDGQAIDDMPMDTTVGPARVIEIKDPVSIKVGELEPYDIQPGERLLFKTRNSPEVYKERELTGDYVYFSEEAARYLVEKKVRLVALDYLAIGNFRDKENLKAVHEILLLNGIYAIEGVNLDGVEPGEYELLCLPLRVEKGDAGPCRAILIPLERENK